MALSYTQDHVGLMARSVEDVALGLQIVAGHDLHDPSSSRAPVGDYLDALTRRRPLRIGLLSEHFFERARADVAGVTRGAVDRLAAAGATVEDARYAAANVAAKLGGSFGSRAGRDRPSPRNARRGCWWCCCCEDVLGRAPAPPV
jgi:aspartyl-tRNA(Asn)/glutamyl-tRNA(Gln) amidotransferase subunit A